METEERFTGTVKVFNPLKGYGFITRTKGKDVFFHYLDIITNGADASILEGHRVEFSIGTRDGKTRALRVLKIG